MHKMRKWYVVLVALAVIAVAWGIGTRLFMAQKSAAPESPLASVSFAYYKNAKGQPWAIQTGESKFTVASQEVYPRFVLGNINPTKVSIGDTQKMQIVVRDNVPLTKVWAVIEHDHGTTTVPLALGASSTVSYNTIQNQKYLVGSDGKLAVNNGDNTPAIAALVQSLVQKAQAEQAVDYSYSGSWVVHDTATITYHTTFYAEDAQGRTTKLILAWSDPCSISNGGALQSACNLANATIGTNAMNTNLNGLNLTLESGGLYVVNPGYSILLTTAGSSITFIGGDINTNQYLYYQDQDEDGYAATTTETASTQNATHITIGSTNYTLASSIAGGQFTPTLDCDDYNSNVYPGQTAYFSSPIVDSGGTSAYNGTFNYACGSSPTINPAQVSDAAACVPSQDPQQYLTGAVQRDTGSCSLNFKLDWCSNVTSISTANCGQTVLGYVTLYAATSTCSGSTQGNYNGYNTTEVLQCH